MCWSRPSTQAAACLLLNTKLVPLNDTHIYTLSPWKLCLIDPMITVYIGFVAGSGNENY